MKGSLQIHQSCTNVIFITSKFYFLLSGTTEVSRKDIATVVKFLAPVDLQNLYEALDIPKREVQKAEASASISDVDLKAKDVLRQWKQKRGKLATRQAILDALEECENLEAKEKLEKEWTGKGNNTIFFFM